MKTPVLLYEGQILLETKLDEIKQLEQFFESDEGRRCYARLLRYAGNRLRRYQVGEKNLGLTPEDVLQDTITRVLDGTRSWSPEKHSNIEKYLMNNIDSVIDHSFDTVDVIQTQNILDDEEGEQYIPPTAISEINDYTGGLQTPTPEELILSDKERDELNAKILMILGSYPDLEEIALCILEGILKPQEIAKELNIEVKEVYNRKKRIKLKLKEIYNKS